MSGNPPLPSVLRAFGFATLLRVTDPRSGAFRRLANFGAIPLNGGVSDDPPKRRSSPPYNPAVKKLIEEKRQWSSRAKNADAWVAEMDARKAAIQ